MDIALPPAAVAAALIKDRVGYLEKRRRANDPDVDKPFFVYPVSSLANTDVLSERSVPTIDQITEELELLYEKAIDDFVAAWYMATESGIVFEKENMTIVKFAAELGIGDDLPNAGEDVADDNTDGAEYEGLGADRNQRDADAIRGAVETDGNIAHVPFDNRNNRPIDVGAVAVNGADEPDDNLFDDGRLSTGANNSDSAIIDGDVNEVILMPHAVPGANRPDANDQLDADGPDARVQHDADGQPGADGRHDADRQLGADEVPRPVAGGGRTRRAPSRSMEAEPLLTPAMWLGLCAVWRGYILINGAPSPSGGIRGKPDGVGMYRRLFARDVIVSAAAIATLQLVGALSFDELVGAIASTSAGWFLSAAALFANRDPTGPDPPGAAGIFRIVLAAVGIVFCWAMWAQVSFERGGAPTGAP